MKIIGLIINVIYVNVANSHEITCFVCDENIP